MVIPKGKQGWGDVEECTGGINSDGRRLDLVGPTHKEILFLTFEAACLFVLLLSMKTEFKCIFFF